MNEFQERLQDLLIENNLSRLQLSKLVSISFETLNGYFNKNFYPELSVAVKISNHFKCSIDYLMGLSEDYNNDEKNQLAFCETVKCLAKQRKTTVKKVMNDIGMDETNFYRWQRGNNRPSMTSLIAIAKYFEVSVDYLIYKHKQ